MSKLLPYIITALLLCFAGSAVFGQATQNHRVSFSDIDGFSGEVSFTSSREGFATQLRGKNATLVLSDYRCTPEEKEALKKAGLNFWVNYRPKTFGVVLEGRAYITEDGYVSYQIGTSKLHLNNGLGDFTTPSFEKDVQERATKWRNTYKTSYWEDRGGFNAETVTELYLSDLKNEIDRITYAAKKEKQEAEQKEKEAKEKQEAAAKEKAEKEKQEAAAKKQEAGSGGTAASGSRDEKDEKSDDKDGDKEEKDRDKKSSKTVYIPKSNRQLYNELKAMTDAHPEMLNDPKVRTRLRGYKAFADRDDRNIRDYNTLEQTMGGGYNPNKITAMNSIYQTNANIANAEMAVDAGVDAATNVVNSIIEEKNRKEEQLITDEKGKQAAAMAKKEAIAKWEKQLKEKREAYEKETEKTIKANFNLVATLGDVPITYETEEYKRGKTYWQGQVQITPHEFVKKTVTMKETWGSNDKKYKLYIAELNGLYGILGDDGEALYPPQFEGLYALEVVGQRPRFLVNIKDKWGEILADGSIAEAIKYDGIWYAPDKKSKILKNGDSWLLKSVDGNRLLKQFTTAQIPELYAGGLISVGNTNEKGFSQSNGSYSLAGNGKIYVWGKSKEKGVGSIPYESAKVSQTTERLFKLDDKWYISTGFGTESMKIEPMPQKFVVPVLRAVGSAKKWGAINENGETVIPFEYSFMEMNKQGISTNNGKFYGEKYQTKWLTQNNRYYENGKLKEVRNLNDENNLEGEVLVYYENGNLKQKLFFINGKQTGEQRVYGENGSLIGIENWLQGKKNGKATYYFESGELGEEGQFEKGKKAGEWKTYYKSGALQKTGGYQDGLETGIWKTYNADGTPQTTLTYENGGITNIIEH